MFPATQVSVFNQFQSEISRLKKRKNQENSCFENVEEQRHLFKEHTKKIFNFFKTVGSSNFFIKTSDSIKARITLIRQG